MNCEWLIDFVTEFITENNAGAEVGGVIPVEDEMVVVFNKKGDHLEIDLVQEDVYYNKKGV